MSVESPFPSLPGWRSARQIQRNFTVPFPFEADFEQLQSDLDAYVDATFGCLVMPKGYEVVRRAALGLLGRLFSGDRDPNSELISAIEDTLSRAGISARKTERAERLAAFDQAPNFVVPSEFSPHVVIEARLAEDDGTARDTVTRVQHLAALSMQGQPPGPPRFEVVACIAGRGFGARREDMKTLLLATRGKVFTLQTLSQLVPHTGLSAVRSR